VDLRTVAEVLPHTQRSGSAALLHLLDVGIDRGTRTSPFVDLDWYGRVNHLSDEGPRARFTHLVTDGRRRGLAPSPWLDLEWYSHRHAEIERGGLDALDYFLAVGRWLQRFPHPCWDEDRYVGLNDYVRTAVGSGKYSSGFEHFCSVGHDEAAREAIALPLRVGEREDEYSEHRYRSVNPDVEAAVRSEAVRSGLEHLMTTGYRQIVAGERRLKEPSPFASAVLRHGGAAATGTLLVLLNHYDVDGTIDPHLDVAIDTYRRAGADVVLITTGADDDALRRLDDRLLRVLVKSRNDDLRDFGGWHHAFEQLGSELLDTYERVILTNDSVYFPVHDPERFLTALGASEAGVFAATDSVSGGRYHLQSYFLALAPRARQLLQDELARRVAEQAEGTKLTLIQRFEVGLSEFLIAAGSTTEVFVGLRDIDDLAQAMSPPDTRRFSRLAATVLNLTHHFWRHTLDSGLPFLKVELLRDNPVEVDIDGWEAVVDGDCTADIIAAHLARVRR
jgi:rhamnosyltransferase